MNVNAWASGGLEAGRSCASRPRPHRLPAEPKSQKVERDDREVAASVRILAVDDLRLLGCSTSCRPQSCEDRFSSSTYRSARTGCRHTNQPWVLLYIERWLKAPMQMEDGSVVLRTAGTPQGGVVSPVLANLFLHYAFRHLSLQKRRGGAGVMERACRPAPQALASSISGDEVPLRPTV